MQILKCLVDRVIPHPGDITDEEMTEIKLDLSAPDNIPDRRTDEKGDQESEVDIGKLISDMPRNSIVATPIGTSHQVSSIDEKIICYPFFSSHLVLPIKAGEFVWVMSEKSFDNEENIGSGPFYWMSRVHGSLISEDVSFTHYERQMNVLNISFSKESRGEEQTKKQMREYQPAFRGDRIFSEDNKLTAYDARDHVEEPVPRLTKHPGDLVIQGSHNTSITMGTSYSDMRGLDEILNPEFSQDETQASRAFFDPDVMTGAIDIVVGRSNNLKNIEVEEGSEVVSMGKNGEPLTVRNEDGHLEVKKNPTFLDITEESITHPRLYNINEGDPDILHDASRIYLGREEDVDDLFGIPELFANNMFNKSVSSEELNGSDKGSSPEVFKSKKSYESVFPIAKDSQGSCIAARSKNIRIVASSFDKDSRSIHVRKKNDDDSKEVFIDGEQGSIILIKEGRIDSLGTLDPSQREDKEYASESKFGDQTQDISAENQKFTIEHASEAGNGRAVIALGADGTIYIDGPRIVIGSGNEKDNGEGTQISLGIDSHEPVVMGNQLHGILSAIINVLDNHIHPTGTGPSGKRVPGGSEVAPGAFTNTVDDISDLKLMLSKIAKTK